MTSNPFKCEPLFCLTHFLYDLGKNFMTLVLIIHNFQCKRKLFNIQLENKIKNPNKKNKEQIYRWGKN